MSTQAPHAPKPAAMRAAGVLLAGAVVILIGAYYVTDGFTKLTWHDVWVQEHLRK